LDLSASSALPQVILEHPIHRVTIPIVDRVQVLAGITIDPELLMTYPFEAVPQLVPAGAEPESPKMFQFTVVPELGKVTVIHRQ
jgi:hypothetical protein